VQKFYCPYALADGNHSIWIKEKLIEFSSKVLSTQSTYRTYILTTFPQNLHNIKGPIQRAKMTPQHSVQMFKYQRHTNGWLSSRVVNMLDSGTEGFKSQPPRCRVTVLGKLFTPTVPLFTKQRNW